jgi:hypothetical protein
MKQMSRDIFSTRVKSEIDVYQILESLLLYSTQAVITAVHPVARDVAI